MKLLKQLTVGKNTVEEIKKVIKLSHVVVVAVRHFLIKPFLPCYGIVHNKSIIWGNSQCQKYINTMALAW